ncbi:MAG: hypothetical protein ABIP94_16670, partial [Planctomycetota bacterium]
MNRKASLLVLSLALLAAVIAAIVWWNSETAGGWLDQATPRRAHSAAEADAASLPVDASTELCADNAVRAVAAMATRSTRPLPENASWVEITVLDAATESPVAGAAVAWFDID